MSEILLCDRHRSATYPDIIKRLQLAALEFFVGLIEDGSRQVVPTGPGGECPVCLCEMIEGSSRKRDTLDDDDEIGGWCG